MMSRKPFTCCISRPKMSLLEAAFLPKRNEALGSFTYADSGGFPSMCRIQSCCFIWPTENRM